MQLNKARCKCAFGMEFRAPSNCTSHMYTISQDHRTSIMTIDRCSSRIGGVAQRRSAAYCAHWRFAMKSRYIS